MGRDINQMRVDSDGAVAVRNVDANGAASPGLTEATFTDRVGERQASPTANTILDRLKALLTGIVLAAGSAIIGRVGIDQTTPGTTNAVTTRDGYSAAVTLTRTADTNAYTANDVVGAATGATAALTFASMGPSGGEIMITSVALEIDAAALIGSEAIYTLHLYSITPPSALGDNAAFDLPSGDRASYLGAISLGTPVDLGATLYIASDSVNKQVKLAGTSLFGYLVTAAAYTPASARVYVITLHSMAV